MHSARVVFRAPKVTKLKRCLRLCPNRQAAQAVELSLCLSLSLSFCFFCPALHHHVAHEMRRVVSRCYRNRFCVKHFPFSLAASNVSAVLAPKSTSSWVTTFQCYARASFSRVLLDVKVSTCCVSRCSVFSVGEKRKMSFSFTDSILRVDVTGVINVWRKKKTMSVLSQRFPRSVESRHTYAKKSLLAFVFLFSFFLFFPVSIHSLDPMHSEPCKVEKRNKIKHFQIVSFYFVQSLSI